AEERRARMRRDAEFRVEQERKAVRDALLREAVVAATAAAEALIQKQMSRSDQDRMAADYLASVRASVSGAGPRATATGQVGGHPNPRGAGKWARTPPPAAGRAPSSRSARRRTASPPSPPTSPPSPPPGPATTSSAPSSTTRSSRRARARRSSWRSPTGWTS